MCVLSLGVSALRAAEPAAAEVGAREQFIAQVMAAPTVLAARDRVIAAQRTAAAAGRLPDPMVGAGYARKSSMSDRWPMYEATLEQPLPRWGERSAQRARARADETLGAAEWHEAAGEVAAEVAALIADAEAARATLALVDEQVARATALRSSIAVRVAAGTSRSADLLGIDSRLASLAITRDTLIRQIADAENDARARLGVASDAQLPSFTAPERPRVMLDRVPGVVTAQAKHAEAEAMFQEARASRYPETAVGVRYEREQQPGEPMNTVGVTVRVSLPVWQSASAEREDAAAARQRAAQREASASQQRAQAALDRADRASAVARRARLAAETAAARLTTEYDALIHATATGTVGASDLLALFDILDRLSDTQRQAIDAQAAAHQAEASLWRLAPPAFTDLSAPRTLP